MKTFKIFLTFSLFLTLSVAWAGSMTINLTAPTLNMDQTPIPVTGPGSIASYTAYYGICVNNDIPATPQIATSTTLTIQINNLAPGTWCVRATATNTFGPPNGESNKTNVGLVTILPPKPMPPSSLVIADMTIYQTLGTKDRLAFLPVGTAPSNTACDPKQSMSGYLNNVLTDMYVVPQTGVTISWYGRTQPPLIVAVCS